MIKKKKKKKTIVKRIIYKKKKEKKRARMQKNAFKMATVDAIGSRRHLTSSMSQFD